MSVESFDLDVGSVNESWINNFLDLFYLLGLYSIKYDGNN